MNSIIESIKNQIFEIANVFRGREGSDRITQHLVKGTSGAFGLNITTQLLSFIISVILTRLVGTSGYGVYMYALTWILVFNIPAGMGLSRMLIRNVASYHTQSAWNLIVGLVRWANFVVFISSFLIIVLVIVITLLLKDHINPEILEALWFALILVPIVTFMRLWQSIMQGFHRVVIGQLPESLIQPIVFLILISVIYVFFKEYMNAFWTIGMHIVAATIALFGSIYLSYKALPDEIIHSEAKYDTSRWLRSAMAMLFVGVLNIINSRADILMLGAITGTKAVGIYSIAARGADLITFIMMPVHAALGPTIAKLYTNNNIERLQRIITKSTWITSMLSLPIALGFFFFGYWFLLIFGTEFTQGQLTLSILCFGKILNVIIGPVALLLVMTHHERDATIGLGVSAVLNITLNLILIPQWGLEGAAIATTCSVILWNILLSMFVYKRIQIHTSIIMLNTGLVEKLPLLSRIRSFSWMISIVKSILFLLMVASLIVFLNTIGKHHLPDLMKNLHYLLEWVRNCIESTILVLKKIYY